MLQDLIFQKFGLSVKKLKKMIKIFQNKFTTEHKHIKQYIRFFNKLQNKVNLFLKKRKTDLVFLSSDRFETFAFAISTYLRKIPIIHYEGGDLTEGGTLDDNIRHAITKISHIHLTSNNDSKKNKKMGEENGVA